MLKRTPLFEFHKNLNAKIVPFSGWEMPIQYSGVIDEHNTVRNTVGVFDVSHMGEIEIKGKDATSQMQQITTNDTEKLKTGGVQYSLLCSHRGGIIDDLLVYKFSDNHYLLCVNAANTEKDYEWIQKNVSGKAAVVNSSSNFCQIAIQGRYAKKILQQMAIEDISEIPYYSFIVGHSNTTEMIISRTGYTGEDGFEIYFSPDYATQVWETILHEGKQFDIKPIGLAARDTLRIEMAYMLYGNEIDESRSPVEAGLGWIVKEEKGDFIGKEAMQKKRTPSQKLVGFEMTEKGIPRSHYHVLKKDKQIGIVTSGTYSPTLNKSIGIAYVKKEYSSIGEEVSIEIRNKRAKGVIVQTPFYKKKY